MKTLCDINEIINRDGFGKGLLAIPTGTDAHNLLPGTFYGPVGALTNSPDSNKNFIYQSFHQGVNDRFIKAFDTDTGSVYILTKHSGTWDTKWKDLKIDLSNYYTKPETNSKIVDKIHNTYAARTTAGTLKMRLSGTTLYMRTDGKDA